MPSCTAADTLSPMARMTTLGGAAPAGKVPRDQCPKEKYCDEVQNHRPQCPPGRCRYGGPEHDKIPCPDHDKDRPFGMATEGAAKPAKPRRARPARKPAPKKATKKATKKAGRKTSARKTKKTSKKKRK